MSGPPGLLLTFYGDDFTGSTDAMEALTFAGLRTALFFSPPARALEILDGPVGAVLRTETGITTISFTYTPPRTTRR